MKPQRLQDDLKLNFLVKAVFGNYDFSADSLIDAAINLAYRDVSRTIHGYSKTNSASLHSELKDQIKQFISFIIIPVSTKQEFDARHSGVCEKLIQTFNQNKIEGKPFLNYGQTQKWLNMTVKYLLTVSVISDELKEIENNLQWFHVPIDSYIIEWLKEKPISWSKMDKNQYDRYQEAFEKRLKESETSIGREFSIWNELYQKY
jgi:hypothetical protein